MSVWRARGADGWGGALEADLADTQGGTTREGFHLGAMAATVDILQRCFTGLEIRDDLVLLHPQLPDALRRRSSDLHYQVNG